MRSILTLIIVLLTPLFAACGSQTAPPYRDSAHSHRGIGKCADRAGPGYRRSRGS